MRTEDLMPRDRYMLVQGTNYLVMVLGMVGALFKWFSLGTDYPPIPGLIVVSLCVANSAYLRFRRRPLISAWVLVVALLIGLVLSGYNSGGLGGPILLLAPLVPIFAILLIDTLAGWIVLVLVTLLLTGFFVLHLYGVIPENPNTITGLHVGRYLSTSFATIIATWIVWGFAESRRQLEQANLDLANIDHLTGVANRRAYEHRLQKEAALARRNDRWLSLVIADVDHFKRYNDLNGHLSGDKALITVAEVLQESILRPADMIGRFGGEEFIAILPETDSEGAFAIAERMRLSLLDKKIPYSEEDSDDCLSMSLGVVSIQGHAIEIEDLDLLMKAADDALYQSKSMGRNRTTSKVLGQEDESQ